MILKIWPAPGLDDRLSGQVDLWIVPRGAGFALSLYTGLSIAWATGRPFAFNREKNRPLELISSKSCPFQTVRLSRILLAGRFVCGDRRGTATFPLNRGTPLQCKPRHRWGGTVPLPCNQHRRGRKRLGTALHAHEPPCTAFYIGHQLDTAAGEFYKSLILLARPRGFEPLLPP
jgi:hypothetical protein